MWKVLSATTELGLDAINCDIILILLFVLRSVFLSYFYVGYLDGYLSE